MRTDDISLDLTTLLNSWSETPSVVRQPLHFDNPTHIVQLLQATMAGLPQEEMRVILIDTDGNVIDMPVVHRGTLAEVRTAMRDVFREAIRQNAAYLAMAHNHPGSDSTPSDADRGVTARAIEAAAILEVGFCDHFVVSRQGVYSLRADRLLRPDEAPTFNEVWESTRMMRIRYDGPPGSPWRAA